MKVAQNSEPAAIADPERPRSAVTGGGMSIKDF